MCLIGQSPVPYKKRGEATRLVCVDDTEATETQAKIKGCKGDPTCLDIVLADVGSGYMPVWKDQIQSFLESMSRLEKIDPWLVATIINEVSDEITLSAGLQLQDIQRFNEYRVYIHKQLKNMEIEQIKTANYAVKLLKAIQNPKRLHSVLAPIVGEALQHGKFMVPKNLLIDALEAEETFFTQTHAMDKVEIVSNQIKKLKNLSVLNE